MYPARLKKLLRDMADNDPLIRRSSAEALADGDERAIYPLIKALRDENLGVQDAAMRSLMEIREETTAYMVLPLLRENPFLRNTAMIILRELGSIAVPLLYPLLHDKDDDIRKFALDLIHDIQYCDYPEKLAQMLSEDRNANVRASAAKTIGKLQYKRAVPQLIKALGDEEWVCFSALEALTRFKDESALPSMLALLKSPAETLRCAAIEALGKMGSSRAIKPLTGHLSKTEKFEKRATLKSLVQTGSVPSLSGVSDALIEMLQGDNWEDKFTAMKGLVSLKAEYAIHHLVDMAGSLDLSDPESEDRLKVIKEAIHSFGCNTTLIDLLNDTAIKYRGKVIAIEIMGSLKCKKSVPSLIKLLKGNYRDERRSSIKSLGQIDSAHAKQCLLESISDDDSHVRKTAAVALGRIAEMSAFEPLMKMLKIEKYSDVIDSFIEALITINAARFLSRIDEYNDDIRDRVAPYTSHLNSGAPC